MKCAELLNALWDHEQEIRKVDKYCNIKYILIHPEHFFELAKDKDSFKWLHIEEEKVKFAGIPLIRTNEIDYLDFCS